MTGRVEAADPSGSLITASFAAELGRALRPCPVASRLECGRQQPAAARRCRRGSRRCDALDELFGIGGRARLGGRNRGERTARLGDDERVPSSTQSNADSIPASIAVLSSGSSTAARVRGRARTERRARWSLIRRGAGIGS
jgi:hypothetical protein